MRHANNIVQHVLLRDAAGQNNATCNILSRDQTVSPHLLLTYQNQSSRPPPCIAQTAHSTAQRVNRVLAPADHSVQCRHPVMVVVVVVAEPGLGCAELRIRVTLLLLLLLIMLVLRMALRMALRMWLLLALVELQK